MEGASTEHVDQEMNQEMHEVSTQVMGLQLDIKFAISLLKNPIKKTKTKHKHGLSLQAMHHNQKLNFGKLYRIWGNS